MHFEKKIWSFLTLKAFWADYTCNFEVVFTHFSIKSYQQSATKNVRFSFLVPWIALLLANRRKILVCMRCFSFWNFLLFNSDSFLSLNCVRYATLFLRKKHRLCLNSGYLRMSKPCDRSSIISKLVKNDSVSEIMWRLKFWNALDSFLNTLRRIFFVSSVFFGIMVGIVKIWTQLLCLSCKAFWS